MSQKQKALLVSLVNTVLILGVYSLYVFRAKIAPDPAIIDDFRFWGRSFLILIPVTLVAQIVLHVIFAVVNAAVTHQAASEVTDERDRLIELRSARISQWVYAGGLFLAMGSQAIGMRPWVMFAALIGTWFGAIVASTIASLVCYHRGF